MVHKHRSTWKPTNGLARGRGYKYRVPRGPGGNRVTGYDPSSYWRKPEGEPSDVKKGILPVAWMSGGEQVARHPPGPLHPSASFRYLLPAFWASCSDTVGVGAKRSTIDLLGLNQPRLSAVVRVHHTTRSVLNPLAP